ncbi:MAG: argininosuccinate lyase [Candidatus Caldarchaeum sp.]
METAPHRKGILEKKMDVDAAAYTSSSYFDHAILDETVYVNIAHVRVLEKLGVVNKELADKAVAFLSSIIKSGVTIPEHVGDIHIYIEAMLSQKVPEVGEMLALGKSRNDAVVAAVKLKLKQRLYNLIILLLNSVESLFKRSVEESATLFPVYTHLQRAAPATFGFILQAYAIRLYKTVPRLKDVIEACEECPLGSAAVAGTSVPLDRVYYARLLGFRDISRNALEATASRDFLLYCLTQLLIIAVILSSFAEEMVLYSSEEFGLLKMPEEYSATSSIMPQKRNPVVAEIMRTKAAEVLGLVTSLTGILSRQPSGYNLDLQQTTPKLWSALDQVESSLNLLNKMLKLIEVNREKALYSCAPPTAAVEVANYLTLRHGVSFRKAHAVAGRISRLVASHQLNELSVQRVFEEESVQARVGVEDVLSLMDAAQTVERYNVEGSANPRHVAILSSKMLEEIKTLRENIISGRENFQKALSRLLQ